MYGEGVSPEIRPAQELSESSKNLFDVTERITRKADMCQVRMSGIIHCDGAWRSFREEELVFGSDLGKIPLAHLVIENFHHSDTFAIERRHRAPSGGGDWDIQRKTHTATTGELLEDMLKKSGNTPYRVFSEALGGAATINEAFHQKGWHGTRVDTHEDGFARIGSTTTREAFYQMQDLLAMGDDNPLVEIAWRALAENTTTDYGVRQLLSPRQSGVVVRNKTGQYNGDHGEPNAVPYAVRHDVGSIAGPGGEVRYAILSRSPRLQRGYFANAFVGQLGYEMAKAAGSKDNKPLGLLATRAS